ncbi:hypothetical protein [Pseudovibrio sp. POLY-S9]|uniref:hypothetical protein n=1 Tax=Pseudovibrio sp. POLY-S9 TaxID=1576596 RepID=UPI00070F00F4|nr:hypothetical protein [Pseudovibrio sp. POLY-S9]
MPKYSIFNRPKHDVTEVIITNRKPVPGGTELTGKYPLDMTQSQVEQIVKGTFGGRFEEFDQGRFVYTAYND